MKRLLLILILTFTACADFDKPAMVMVSVPGGTFIMGSPDDELDRGTDEEQHPVTLSSFYISKYPVTQKQYVAVMGDIPSGILGGDHIPVVKVTWNDATEFCNELSEMEGLTPVYAAPAGTGEPDWSADGYRLPTEAEWEYACRAGTTTAYNTGLWDGITIGSAPGWYTDNSGSDPIEVGKKPANRWGLYDMPGNVQEWCWDWYHVDYYASSEASNPKGPTTATGKRVLRGGGIYSSSAELRSAARGNYDPAATGLTHVGFRVVRSR